MRIFPLHRSVFRCFSSLLEVSRFFGFIEHRREENERRCSLRKGTKLHARGESSPLSRAEVPPRVPAARQPRPRRPLPQGDSGALAALGAPRCGGPHRRVRF